jgi:hypothetical protein
MSSALIFLITWDLNRPNIYFIYQLQYIKYEKIEKKDMYH